MPQEPLHFLDEKSLKQSFVPNVAEQKWPKIMHACIYGVQSNRFIIKELYISIQIQFTDTFYLLT